MQRLPNKELNRYQFYRLYHSAFNEGSEAVISFGSQKKTVYKLFSDIYGKPVIMSENKEKK